MSLKDIAEAAEKLENAAEDMDESDEANAIGIELMNLAQRALQLLARASADHESYLRERREDFGVPGEPLSTIHDPKAKKGPKP
jgi:hypothetical protein